MSNTGKTKHLEQVREALESLRRTAEVPFYEDEAIDALTALSAHEEDVRELVEALDNLELKGGCFCSTEKLPADLHAAYCVNARAARAKFQGEKE